MSNENNFEVISEKELTNVDVIDDTLYYRDGIGADTCKIRVRTLISDDIKIAQFVCDVNDNMMVLRSIILSSEIPDDIFENIINKSIDEFMDEYEDSFNDMVEDYWMYDYYYIYTANGILTIESTYGHKNTTEELFYNFESGDETTNTNNSVSIYCDKTISVKAPEFSVISIDTKNVKSKNTEYMMKKNIEEYMTEEYESVEAE